MSYEKLLKLILANPDKGVDLLKRYVKLHEPLPHEYYKQLNQKHPAEKPLV